jgi:hypothetical protein
MNDLIAKIFDLLDNAEDAIKNLQTFNKRMEELKMVQLKLREASLWLEEFEFVIDNDDENNP